MNIIPFIIYYKFDDIIFTKEHQFILNKIKICNNKI